MLFFVRLISLLARTTAFISVWTTEQTDRQTDRQTTPDDQVKALSDIAYYLPNCIYAVYYITDCILRSRTLHDGGSEKNNTTI